MKRTVPLLIAAICGVVLIITAFIPATVTWGETAAVWFDVLAAIAFILGGGNLLKVHLKKVSERSAGWAYSFITVATFLLTLYFGMVKWDVAPAADQEFYGQTFAELPISELPPELLFTQPVNLPAEYAEEVAPASVRSQFRMVVEEDRLSELSFSGWITPGQTEDLLNWHNVLEWKCAIEQLAAQAAIPQELAGKITYYADHHSLSGTGMINEALQQNLLQISSHPSWIQAVNSLATASRQKTSLQLSEIPPEFTIPEQYQEVLSREGETLTVTGPMTPAMKMALTDVFPRIRPLPESSIEERIQELDQIDQPLTEGQKEVIKNILGNLWTEQQLVSVLNDAGKRLPIQKSFCQLLQEKEAGETQLELTIPPAEPDVTLNEAQLAAISAAVADPKTDLTTLGAELGQLGAWLPSQESALQQFLNQAPTIGDQLKLLAITLKATDPPLTANQLTWLLTDYRREHLWKEQIYQLYSRAHQTKYPWSGSYLQDGTPFWWSYEFAFKPLTATMFALLAFYVASAAFRAFRAKNLEASLLLGTAFIILLGRTFAGTWLTSGLPESMAGLRIENITMFIMSVINTAGNRAIMIGISLGIVSTSLKILLGVDRSYLGSGDD